MFTLTCGTARLLTPERKKIRYNFYLKKNEPWKKNVLYIKLIL